MEENKAPETRPDVTWPLEEASFLRLVDRPDDLYEELTQFIRDLVSRRGLDLEDGILDDLMAYQKAIIVNPWDSGLYSLSLGADIPDYVTACRDGRKAELVMAPVTYRIDRGRASTAIKPTTPAALSGTGARAANSFIRWNGRDPPTPGGTAISPPTESETGGHFPNQAAFSRNQA